MSVCATNIYLAFKYTEDGTQEQFLNEKELDLF